MISLSFCINNFIKKDTIKYFEENFIKNIYRSDIIITGSEFTKQEILNRLDFKEENIKVIYHGVRHDLFKKLEDITLNFDLPEKFIFSVGSIEPRKNLIGLLKAFDKLDLQIKNEYKLVLVGFKGWENKDIMKIISQNKENIIYLGYISDEDLVKVYNKATCFIYPSFYEGFGLPPLEAMACGTPVICSNTSSLPEVGEDAVLYCDPNNIDDIKENLEVLLKDENLQKELSKKGLVQAQKFTWEKSAKEHIKIFKELLEK
ncbi:glycosyltransferase family 4 protein [Aliarcobacter cryaerophilus]|uniref:glycosyltransferase family 4 protein n=1 Tax=Aliarcobacter cryaerophilus TaxID=28198 RepID=UPI0021B323F6|nr:glycosyltransferase family 1 protein [Aliarcobacter cryaerophilus]MCT7505775.1 glycosyltransferase family 4 protein [Aliarcobacter cryaerophilus]